MDYSTATAILDQAETGTELLDALDLIAAVEATAWDEEAEEIR